MTIFQINVEYPNRIFAEPFDMCQLYRQLDDVDQIVGQSERVRLVETTLEDRISFSLSSETEYIAGARGVDALWSLIDRLDAFLAGRCRIVARSDLREFGPMSFCESLESTHIVLPRGLARL